MQGGDVVPDRNVENFAWEAGWSVQDMASHLLKALNDAV